MTSFPSSVITYATLVDLVDSPVASHENSQGDEITAIETMLVNKTYVMQNYLTGLKLSNNGTDPTNDIDIAAGYCADSTNATMLNLAASITKRLDASWGVGTNQGGLDTGAIANTTYHLWLIKRSDTGVVDCLFSASASAPTMPANYDYKRRIGSIVRTGAAIKTFVQDGDVFTWLVPAPNSVVTNPGTSALTTTLVLPVGVRVRAIVGVLGYGSTASADPQSVFISDLSITDTAPTASYFSIVNYNGSAVANNVGGMVNVFTNTSAQVRARCQTSAATTELYITAHGWVDDRGRNG